MKDPATDEKVGQIGAGRRSAATGMVAGLGPSRYLIGRPANDNSRPFARSLALWVIRIGLVAAIAWGALWLIAQ